MHESKRSEKSGIDVNDSSERIVQGEERGGSGSEGRVPKPGKVERVCYNCSCWNGNICTIDGREVSQGSECSMPMKFNSQSHWMTFKPLKKEEKVAYYNKGGIEVIDIIKAWDLDFFDGNIIKYVLRAKYKGLGTTSTGVSELQDLKKAMQYLKWRIEQIEEGNNG